MASPLVTQILSIMGQKEVLDKQREEIRRRHAAEDLAQNLDIANIISKSAAETPLDQAPPQPVGDLAAAAGVPPMSHDVASFAAQAADQPQRAVTLTLPGGRVIPLAPLRYKEEVEAEKLADLRKLGEVTGRTATVTPEMRAAMDPSIAALFPEGSSIDKSVLVQLAKPERPLTHNYTDDSGKTHVMQWDDRSRTWVEVQPPGGQAQPNAGLSGEEFLKTLPEGTQAVVKKVANYEMPLQQITSYRGNARQALAESVARYDPTFDMTKYEARQKVRNSFTSGRDKDNIKSLNTAIAHLGSFARSGAALKNAPVQLWNTIANYGITNMGDPRVKKFMTDANAVAGELANVFKNTSGTDQEIRHWLDNINSSDSPSQIQASVDEAINLISGRLHVLQQTWDNGMGGKPFEGQMLYPESQAVLSGLTAPLSKAPPAQTGGAHTAPATSMEDLLRKYGH